MQTNLATLLLLVSTVIFSCIVIDYATVAVTETLQTTNIPQLEHLKTLQGELLNQTDNLFNQTLPLPQDNSTSLLVPSPE
jgi:hypothetical protein